MSGHREYNSKIQHLTPWPEWTGNIKYFPDWAVLFSDISCLGSGFISYWLFLTKNFLTQCLKKLSTQNIWDLGCKEVFVVKKMQKSVAC